MTVPLDVRVALDRTRLDRLAATVGEHTTLTRVLDWARRREPPAAIHDIVTQDEYTHDVIVPYEGGLYLVYDVT